MGHKCLCNTVDCDDYGTDKCRISVPKFMVLSDCEEISPELKHTLKNQLNEVFQKQHKTCPDCALMAYFYSILDFIHTRELMDDFLDFSKAVVYYGD